MMFTVTFFLTILLAVCIILCFNQSRLTMSSLVVIVLGTVVWMVVRFGFDGYFMSFDESYYLWVFSKSINFNVPLSGIILPVIGRLLVQTLHLNPVLVLNVTSLVSFIILPLLVIYVYKKISSSDTCFILGVILFMSSYYIWASLEVRPQQWGMLFGVVLIFLYYSINLDDVMDVVILIGAFVLLSLFHLLSALLFWLVLLLHSSIYFIIRPTSANAKKVHTIFLSGLFILAIFFFGPVYSPMLGSTVWILKSSSLPGFSSLTVKSFIFFGVIGYLVLTLLWWVGVKYLSRNSHVILYMVIPKIKSLLSKRFNVVLYVSIFGFLLAMYFQFLLNRNVYSHVYSAYNVFILVQMGNIFFGVAWLFETLKRMRDGTLGFFDELSILMVVVGGLALGISFLMPRSNGLWGFNNWLIRILQYFTIFAAPMVGEFVWSEYKQLSRFNRGIFIVIISTLIFLSSINVARPSPLFNYGGHIGDDVEELTKTLKFGDFVVLKANSTLYNFIVGNYLRSQGIVVVDWKISPFVPVVSSYDSFDVIKIRGTTFLNNAKKYSLAYFVPSTTNNSIANIEEYYGGVFLTRIFVLKYPRYPLCPNVFDTSGLVILTGSPSTNVCIKFLLQNGYLIVPEENGLLYSPKGNSYGASIGSNWWDVKEGYFVIEAVSVGNSTAIVIIGTDIDSTIAGIYYLTMNLLNSQKPPQFHYIIGKWKDTDNVALSRLLFSPTDKNGFSLGDQITIVETG